jgi:hypothetical protein
VEQAVRKQKPIRPGRFVIPDTPGAKPYLVGSKCRTCGAVFSHPRVICLNCGRETVEGIALGGKGTVYSYTVVWQQLPNAVVKVPYAIVIARMDEGCQITGVCTEDFRQLKVGSRVEVYFEKAKEDADGTELMIDKFRPIQ